MKHIRFFILTISLFIVALATAQTRGVASNAIPGDNNLRYYRLALPVTVSAYQEDLGSDYNNVLRFWQECEEYANRMFVPLGICFDVVEDSRLVMSQPNMIDENIYNVNFGTELTDAAVGSDAYDVGMWIHHRSEFDENTGLSIGNGAYNTSTKSNGYAKTDKWVVAHELGHMFGADFHTSQGEGSLMDNEGEFFSYPSILLIREESVNHGVSGAHTYKSVTNSAPVFDANVMKDTYRIPQGACIAIPVSATDEHIVTYSAIGCSSANINDVNGEDGMLPYFRSLAPQSAAVIDYRPQYRADINDEEFYFVTEGTDVPSMSAGSYPIAFLANDMPASTSYDYLLSNPFYSNYAVWDATVQIVGGTAFKASLTPQKSNYSAGESVTVEWGVNNNVFTEASRLRITMSADYGETFPYVLAESVPATDGSCTVTLPSVNVGNVDVDFVTATRSMRGGIIRVEEIGGVAYTLTTLSPESGGGFTVTGGSDAPDPVVPTTYTVSVQTNPATSGTATVNGNSTATVDSGSTVTLIATPYSGDYKFDGWYLNGELVSTNSPYIPTVTGNATYIAKFSKEGGVEPEPEQPAQTDGYYYVINRDTNRREYLYNNALLEGNDFDFTLQSADEVSTNNGIWYIDFNDNKTLGIKNGDGKLLVAGANWGGSIAGSYDVLTINETFNVGDFCYYYFSEAINCTNGSENFKVNNEHFVTTWSDGGNAQDNQWRLEPIDMKNKSVYEVDIVDSNVYVTYTNGTNTEYAYKGGFFITDGAIDTSKLGIVGNEKAEIVVEDNVIRVFQKYTITVDAENGGTASSSAATVKHGDKVTLTATVPDGYTFDGWYDSDGKLVDESKSNPYTFEVKGNIDYTAKFTQIPAGNTYTITVTRNNEGGLAFINDKDVTEGVYSEGDIITLYAVEDVNNSGYLFVGWYKNDEEVTTDKECEIEVEENAEYEARFEKGCVVQALDKSRICQVTIYDENDNFGTGRLVVKSGEKVTLSAYLDPGYIDRGYVFSGWEDINGNVVNEQQYTITVTQDVSYLAVVELASYTLRVSTPDKNMGSVKAISGAQDWGEKIKVSYKTPAYLSAIPNEGYVFEKWTLNGEVVNLAEFDGTANEYVLPAINDLNAMVDVEYVAHFVKKPETTYKVTAETNPYNAGEVTFSKKEVEYGGSITLTATVNTYYTFVNWTLDGKVVGTDPALTVNNVTQDLLYVANYKVEDPRHHRKYRLKVYNDGRYMNVKNHDEHGQKVSAGGVNVAAKVAGDSKAQIFFFEKNGEGYMLKDGDGYYIKGLEWSVDASSTAGGSVLFFEETNIKDVYYIKWNNSYKSDVRYFKVGADSNGAGDHPYCDVAEGNKETVAAKWVLEEVADKSKLQELIAEATALFNQVADDKTKINIAGKITSNAGHNTEDGNAENYKDGGGIAALTDSDPATYFHSRWKGTDVYEPHYLQINLGEDESLSNFCFEYATRKAGSANETSPAPTEIEVRVSADGSNFGNPVATYTSGTDANSLPAYRDLGKTWMSDVISSQNNIRAIRLTVTNSAGPGGNTFNSQYFFAMGTLNLYSTQPSLKDEYKDYPLMTENLLLAVAAALGNANDVNDNDAATTEEVNEALKDLRAQKEALESALIPASFTLKQLTASDLMKKTEPTYIAVKNISGTNNRWFAGTSNVVEFGNSTVLVWEPVVEGKSGSYYIRNTYGKYIQNTTPISFGTVTNAAVFTAVNATSKGSGNAYFNGDSGNADTQANINTADDPNLVRFVTGTQWINVQTAGGNPTYNNGEGGYTVHFVYEATMVNEFTVNVTDAQFATFYAPVKVELPDNAKAYIINNIESHDWVSLAEVEGNVLPEKTAIILHSETPGDCKLAVTNETADAEVDGNKLLGTVNDAYVVKNSEKLYYILAKRNDAVGMYIPVLGENVNKFKNRANKAYLVLDEIEVPQMSAGFRFILPGATAVEEVTTEKADVETIYDLQGRKLTEIASPGIYIINGKKVFVK